MTNNDLETNKIITLPYCYRDENTESEVKLAGKGCNFPYKLYTYLQGISYKDEECVGFRKIYTYSYERKVLGINRTCREIKIGDKTVSNGIKYLKEFNFLSSEFYLDEEGEYIKLYDLDKSTYRYITLTFEDKALNQILIKLKDKPIQLLIYYKFNSWTHGVCVHNNNIIAKNMGISRDVLVSYNRILEELGLLRITKCLKPNNRYGNVYRCSI